MRRSHGIAQAMLRLAGLDKLGMDLEEARLRYELGPAAGDARAIRRWRE
jgi:hypothetical protein